MSLRLDEPPPQETAWTRVRGFVSVSLKIGIVAALALLGWDYLKRQEIAKPMEKKEVRLKIHPDYYVSPSRTEARTLAHVRERIVGKTLWMRQGFRWVVQPTGTLAPLEKIEVTGARQRGGQIELQFQREGQRQSIAVGPVGRLFIDDMFFSRDPHQLYDHWSDEDWDKIAARTVETGMTEHQINYVLGVGTVKRGANNLERRTIEYRLCEEHGMDPVRVRYEYGIAQSVTPLPPTPQN